MKNFGYILAPKVLVVNKLKVQFMYHEKPDNKNDSGWRIFSGEEGQEYVDNPNNIAIYDVETILSIDIDIEKYLLSPIGVAFERKEIDKDFIALLDFKFSEDNAMTLQIPYIRKSVRDEVENRAQKNENGQLLDANTGQAIEGKYDLDHKTAYEYLTTLAKAEERNLNQYKFNDLQNISDNLQLEDHLSNYNHTYEQKSEYETLDKELNEGESEALDEDAIEEEYEALE